MNKESAYLEQIIQQMVLYSQLNFDSRLETISDEPGINEIIPGLAVGVNILGEELKHKVEELKKVNDELEQRNRFIVSVTQSIPGLLFVYNRQQHQIVYINKQLENTPDFPGPETILRIARLDEEVAAEAETAEPQNTITRNDSGEIGIHEPGGKSRWYKITTDDFEKTPAGVVTSRLFSLTDITLLKEKETELIRNKQIISNSLEEKELLLQEVHHRVKNNLQIIAGLIELQMNRAEPGILRNQLQEIKNRIHTIALIHEELYQHENFSEVNMSVYCERLCNSLAVIYNDNTNVSMKYDIDPDIYFNLGKAVPFGLLINEIICNSFKHGFRNVENGVIQTTLKKNANSYQLEIKDNGTGLTEKNEPVTSGYPSLGNKLIRGLTSQIGGILTIESTSGYSVIISIPYN